MKVLALLRMGPSNSTYHLTPIMQAIAHGELTVVRPVPLPPRLSEVEGLAYRDTSGGGRLVEIVKTFTASLLFSIRERPDLIVSFNAYPYGVIAAMVGTLTSTPFHIGFVGSDVHALRRRRLLNRWLDRAVLITVPGSQMEQDLRGAGFLSRIVLVPHSIDTSRFKAGLDSGRTIDCVFVGRLVESKRVDLLLSALKTARTMGSEWSLIIIGDGPELDSLQQLTRSSKLDDLVEFAGYVEDPSPILRKARIIAMPSKREGLPFALIEGMASGAIPVATPVGDIPSLIRDGHNGILLHSSDPEEVARAIERVLVDRDLQRHLRANALRSSADHSFELASSIWATELAALQGDGADHPAR